jgi:serine phosphatase RsbU (regulator of sigma subunit)
MPAAVLGTIVLADLLIGRGQSLIGLQTMPPLLAATALGRRATVGYGLLALLAAVLVGVYDRQYTDVRVVAQSIRLVGITLATVLAVGACTLRLRRETRLSQLTAQAATDQLTLRTAESLQLRLLGDPPRVDRLETAVRYLPATRHAQIGGDWYDAFTAPDGSTLLVIGDVAGHDAPAAAAMAQTRAMVRALAQGSGRSPAAVLDALDRAFAQLEVDTLVTAVVASADLRTRTDDEEPTVLRWSNAGHLPPVLVRADGRVELLERFPERLIGVAPDARRSDNEVTLRPGDTVVFYTDGLVERRGAVLDDGMAWLVGELRVLGREPLDRLCDELLAELGGRVDDDVALLAVRVPPRPPGQPRTAGA